MGVRRALFATLILLGSAHDAHGAVCERGCETDTYQIIERLGTRSTVLIRNQSGMSISAVCARAAREGYWHAEGKKLDVHACTTHTLSGMCEYWKQVPRPGWPFADTNCASNDSLERMRAHAQKMGARASETFVRVPAFPAFTPASVAENPPLPPVPRPPPASAPPPPAKTEAAPVQLTLPPSLETHIAGIAANLAEIRTSVASNQTVLEKEDSPLESFITYLKLALLTITTLAVLFLLVQLSRALRELSYVGRDVSTIKNLYVDEMQRNRRP